MIYPKFLEKGQTIGIPAPSSGLVEDKILKYNQALKSVHKLGYKTVESENRFCDDFHVSATSSVRAEEFLRMWKNENINAIISLGGGEFMVEILPFLKAEEFKKSTPKFFQGFSDNTVLVYYLTTSLDIATIYGYNFLNFGMKKWHGSLNDNFSLLTGQNFSFKSMEKYQTKRYKNPKKILSGFNLTKNVKWTNVAGNKKVSFTGRMIGGCLDILVTILGTKFDKTKEFIEKYASDGIIWYLETCDLTVPETIRALWQLKNADWFKYVKGFVFGRPLISKTFCDLTNRKAVVSQLSDLNVPIIMNADIGHLPPTMPVLNGAIATVNYENYKGEITYSLK